MRFILTNLFTTLWCQRKHNPRRLLLVRLALVGRGHQTMALFGKRSWAMALFGRGHWVMTLFERGHRQ